MFRIPRSHYHARLQDFDWSCVKPGSLRQHITKFYYEVLSGESPHLILTGPPGCGKTHLGIGLYRVLAAAMGTQLCTWVNVPAFCEAVKKGYGDHGASEVWTDYESARRFVVLDDMFGRELTAHDKDQILYRLLDSAYSSGAGMVITMNPPAEELAQRLPPHEISRVLSDSKIVPMTSSKDWRRA